MNDPTQAQVTLEILKQKYPNDILTMIAQHQVGEEGGSAGYLAKGSPTAKSSETAISHSSTTAAIPHKFILKQNYPNPFNPTTTIRFGLPKSQHVSLKIYAITGEEVATLIDGYRQKGYHELQWDGRNSAGREAASGVYIYLVRAGDERLVGKMLLVR